MKIGLIIPCTSRNRNWSNIKQTYLFNYFLKSFIESWSSEHEYVLYIGYDKGDRIFSNKSEQDYSLIVEKVYTNIHLTYMEMNEKPGHLTAIWNRLFRRAYDEGCDYFYQCGDDISFKTKNWVNDCIQQLKEKNNIGLTGPINNNPRILTQAFVSREHMHIFGEFFPETIINWCCDDWYNFVYSPDFFYPLKNHYCSNEGGEPRYTINADANFANNAAKKLDELRESTRQLALKDSQKIINYITSKNDKNVKSVIDLNVACCLCVRNCAPYLPQIFLNLNRLSQKFKTFSVIFVYDNCTDNSEELIRKYSWNSSFKTYVETNPNRSALRPVRIANARNTGLTIINELKPDFHFMIDADDINTEEWNIDTIVSYLSQDTWDSLSFNREDYYDIWALLYEDYKHHCWGFHSFSPAVVEHMKKDISLKLKNMSENDLFPCYSAFNGFAIYRTSVFKDCVYSGHYEDVKKLISDEERMITLNKLKKELPDIFIQENYPQCCEHIYYHMCSKSRIRISPKSIFIL
jgi:hypothetical protein